MHKVKLILTTFTVLVSVSCTQIVYFVPSMLYNNWRNDVYMVMDYDTTDGAITPGSDIILVRRGIHERVLTDNYFYTYTLDPVAHIYVFDSKADLPSRVPSCGLQESFLIARLSFPRDSIIEGKNINFPSDKIETIYY